MISGSFFLCVFVCFCAGMLLEGCREAAAGRLPNLPVLRISGGLAGPRP